jgi:hypothetical protein
LPKFIIYNFSPMYVFCNTDDLHSNTIGPAWSVWNYRLFKV